MNEHTLVLHANLSLAACKKESNGPDTSTLEGFSNASAPMP